MSEPFTDYEDYDEDLWIYDENGVVIGVYEEETDFYNDSTTGTYDYDER